MKTLRETEDIVCTRIRQLLAFPNMVLGKIYLEAVNASCTFQLIPNFWLIPGTTD